MGLRLTGRLVLIAGMRRSFIKKAVSSVRRAELPNVDNIRATNIDQKAKANYHRFAFVFRKRYEEEHLFCRKVLTFMIKI